MAAHRWRNSPRRTVAFCASLGRQSSKDFFKIFLLSALFQQKQPALMNPLRNGTSNIGLGSDDHEVFILAQFCPKASVYGEHPFDGLQAAFDFV